MWEFEKRNGALPDGSAQIEEVQKIAEDIWLHLGINPKGVKSLDPEIIQ